MDVLLVSPFIEGALYILDTTATVKVKSELIFIKKSAISLGDISGILIMDGDVSASVLLFFIEKVFLELFLQFLEKK